MKSSIKRPHPGAPFGIAPADGARSAARPLCASVKATERHR
jgi:hypothetical protein